VNDTYGPWPQSGELEKLYYIRFGTCPDASSISGEIDIIEARGNGPKYPAQYARPTQPSRRFPRLTEAVSLQRHQLRSRILELGPTDMAECCLEDLRLVVSATIHLRRQLSHLRPRMDRGFPVRTRPFQTVFSLPGHRCPTLIALLFLLFQNSRIYVDNRLQHMLDLRFNIPFFQRGKFPTSVANASQEIILPNPWAGRGNSAPFDQRTSCNSSPSSLCRRVAWRDTPPDLTNKEKINPRFRLTAFYLILDVAIGGTNGWFPDGAGNKPWLNGAISEWLVE
jgi:hypothetical protein